MAENTVKARLQHAYKTESEWNSSNPILKSGEVGYVGGATESANYGRYKVGDGSTAWKNLPWGDKEIYEKVDEIEIGGRNLWINSSIYRESTPYSRTTTSVDFNTSSFANGIKIYSTEPFNPGDKITIQGKSNLPWSSKHGGSSTNKGKVGYWLYYGTLSQAQSGTYTSPVFVAGDGVGTVFKKTVTVPTVNGVSPVYIAFRFNIYSDGEESITGKFWDIKLEKGNKATDWTPAPEDKANTIHSHVASDITSGTFNTSLLPTVPVSKGGTGLASLTSGQVLIGNGTGNVGFRAIDATNGGTSGSTSLITSGAVFAGLAGKSNTGHTHNYLPLTGGTLTINSYYGLTIKRSDANGAAISYQNSAGAIGGAGFLSDGNFQVSSGSNTNGNIFKANTTSAVFPGTVTATTFIGNLNGTATKATLLNPNNGVTTGSSTWRGGITDGKVVWGQNFKDTSISGDTGDLTLWLAPSGTMATLNMSIDGNYYATGNKPVLHSGNYTSYTVTKTGTGASGTWGINITGSAVTATKWQTARTITIGKTGKSVDGSENVSWSINDIGALPQIIGYYGSNTANTNGWYKVCTVSQSGYSDFSINLLITHGYGRQASGLVHIHTRCDNGTSITIKTLKWLYRYGFNAEDLVITTGNNTWSLYVMNTNTQHGRIQVQVLSKSGTAGDTTFTLTNNETKESSSPNGTSATDGATVQLANTASKWTTPRTLTLTGSITGSVSIDGSGNVSLATTTNHTHNYAASPSAGGAANLLYLPRVTGSSNDANYQPGGNRIQAKEFGNDCTNIPSAHWYHIFTSQGSDANYNTQLALGMTKQAVYYRYRNAGTWGTWKQIAFTDSDITGNAASASQIYSTKTNPTSGTVYYVPFHSGIGSSNKSLLSNDGIKYWTKEGTTDAIGVGELGLGNNTASGTAGNKKGMLYMYGTSSGYTEISCGNNTTSNISLILPASGGTLARTVDNVASASKLQTARTIALTGSVTGSVSFDGSDNVSIATTTNHNHDGRYVYDKANSNGTFNTVAGWRNAIGMVNITAPTSDGAVASAVNPNSQTGWHHFINMSYAEQTGSNMWQTQIANKAGTTDLWVRSRSGGAVSDSTAWAAPWTRILTGTNYTNVLDSRYVKKSGDTVTGNISYNMNSSTQIPFKVYGGDANGQGISVGAGAATIVGAGESAKACESLLSATTEELWLTSDNSIKFFTNCNTIDNRVGVTLDNSRNFYPNTTNNGSLGTSSYKWANAYAATFHGNLDGKLTTARKINGTDFDGSSDITTSKWGTSRTITTAGDFAGSFSTDGSGNVNYSLYNYNSYSRTNNKNNYPYHRIAKLDAITSSYQDRSTLLYITQDYNGGGFGIVRVSLRTNNSSSVSGVEARWLVRSGLNADSIQIGLYNVYGATYADVFFKCPGAYGSATIRAIASGTRGSVGRTWTLINSSETNDTTTDDKKTSSECWASVGDAATELHSQAYSGVVSATDSGIANHSNQTSKLQTSRTIFGRSFNGESNVAGQALVYGNYYGTANERYGHGGLQIRENDLVGNTQSDIAYAPSIGFHWSGRIAASLLFNSDGIFYFRKQNFTDRAIIDADVNGNIIIANKFAVGNTSYNNGFIELCGNTPFIDFHFNNSTADYTSRIIETSSGNININGINIYNSTIKASNWFRSTGSTGWYSEDYGGGIYMNDTNSVKVYNNKSFYCANEIRAGLGGSGQFRAVGGNYGFFIRNDGANTYFMLTNSGDAYGSWNGLRPLIIENSTGKVVIGTSALFNSEISSNGNIYLDGYGKGVRWKQTWGQAGIASLSNGETIALYSQKTGSTSWTNSITLVNSNGEIQIPTKTGGGASGTWGISITGNAATASKVANTLSVNGKSYNGSSAVTVGTIGIGYGGTGATTAAAARENLGTMGSVTANGYQGMALRDGSTSGWIRTTSNGIIPYQSGAIKNGHSSLGTSSWYFANAYIDTIYTNSLNSETTIKLNGHAIYSRLTNDTSFTKSWRITTDGNLIPQKSNSSTIDGNDPNDLNIGNTSSYIKNLYYSGSLSKQSDRRIKNPLGSLSSDDAYVILSNSKIEKFTYINDKLQITNYGVYAQDLRDVLIASGIGHISMLNITLKDSDGKQTTDLLTPEDLVDYSVDYSQYVPVLVSGWQYHDKQIEFLKNENESLRNKLILLEQRLEKLEEVCK